VNTRAPCPLRISPLYILVVVYVFGVVAEYNDIDMFFIMSMSTQHSLSAKLTKQRALLSPLMPLPFFCRRICSSRI